MKHFLITYIRHKIIKELQNNQTKADKRNEKNGLKKNDIIELKNIHENHAHFMLIEYAIHAIVVKTGRAVKTFYRKALCMLLYVIYIYIYILIK